MSRVSFKNFVILEKIFARGKSARSAGGKGEKSPQETISCLSQPLRVPLDGPDRKAAVVHSLDDAILGPLDGKQTCTGMIHRLMMGAVEEGGFSTKGLKG